MPSARSLHQVPSPHGRLAPARGLNLCNVQERLAHTPTRSRTCIRTGFRTSLLVVLPQSQHLARYSTSSSKPYAPLSRIITLVSMSLAVTAFAGRALLVPTCFRCEVSAQSSRPIKGHVSHRSDSYQGHRITASWTLRLLQVHLYLRLPFLLCPLSTARHAPTAPDMLRVPVLDPKVMIPLMLHRPVRPTQLEAQTCP